MRSRVRIFILWDMYAKDGGKKNGSKVRQSADGVNENNL